MKELNRYDFSNDKSFATHLLSRDDLESRDLPECDVIALERFNGLERAWLVMRPDEALILARLLIDAVWQVTEGCTVSHSESRSGDPSKWTTREPDEFDLQLHETDGHNPAARGCTLPENR